MTDTDDVEWGPLVRTAAGALVGRPALWPVAVRTVLRVARPGWWRSPPRLPLPAVDYWRFRLVTAYGDDRGGAAPTRDDVVAYLRWCRGVNTAGG